MRANVVFSLLGVIFIGVVTSETGNIYNVVEQVLSEPTISKIGIGSISPKDVKQSNPAFVNSVNAKFKEVLNKANLYTASKGTKKLKATLDTVIDSVQKTATPAFKSTVGPLTVSTKKQMASFLNGNQQFGRDTYKKSSELAKSMAKWVDKLGEDTVDVDSTLQEITTVLTNALASVVSLKKASDNQASSADQVQAGIRKINTKITSEKAATNSKISEINKKEARLNNELRGLNQRLQNNRRYLKTNQNRQNQILKNIRQQEAQKNSQVANYIAEINRKNIVIKQKYEECKANQVTRNFQYHIPSHLYRGRRSTGSQRPKRSPRRLSRYTQRRNSVRPRFGSRFGNSYGNNYGLTNLRVVNTLPGMRPLVFDCAQKYKLLRPNQNVINAIKAKIQQAIAHYQREAAKAHAKIQELTREWNQISARVSAISRELRQLKTTLKETKDHSVKLEATAKQLEHLKNELRVIGNSMLAVGKEFNEWGKMIQTYLSDVEQIREDADDANNVDIEQIRKKLVDRMKKSLYDETIRWMNVARLGYVSSKNT